MPTPLDAYGNRPSQQQLVEGYVKRGLSFEAALNAADYEYQQNIEFDRYRARNEQRQAVADEKIRQFNERKPTLQAEYEQSRQRAYQEYLDDFQKRQDVRDSAIQAERQRQSQAAQSRTQQLADDYVERYGKPLDAQPRPTGGQLIRGNAGGSGIITIDVPAERVTEAGRSIPKSRNFIPKVPLPKIPNVPIPRVQVPRIPVSRVGAGATAAGAAVGAGVAIAMGQDPRRAAIQAAGGVAGAIAGTALGSIGGPIGSAVGGALGGIVGGALGNAAADAILGDEGNDTVPQLQPETARPRPQPQPGDTTSQPDDRFPLGTPGTWYDTGSSAGGANWQNDPYPGYSDDVLSVELITYDDIGTENDNQLVAIGVMGRRVLLRDYGRNTTITSRSAYFVPSVPDDDPGGFTPPAPNKPKPKPAPKPSNFSPNPPAPAPPPKPQPPQPAPAPKPEENPYQPPLPLPVPIPIGKPVPRPPNAPNASPDGKPYPSTPASPAPKPSTPPGGGGGGGGQTGSPCAGNRCGQAQLDQSVANSGKLDQINTALNGLSAFNDQAIMAKLNILDNKLGAQVPGGLSAFMGRFFKWMHLDRILNVLTFIGVMHNAYMLSNSIGQTLFSAFDNIIRTYTIAWTDSEGDNINTGQWVGNQLDSFFKSIFGVATVEGIKTEWKKFNRIYQAASNIISSLQSISYSILESLETVGQWVAKIGNAARKYGVFMEKAYGWMNPNINFTTNRFFNALNKTQEATQAIDTIAGETLNIAETSVELAKQKAELENAMKGLDAEGNPLDKPKPTEHTATKTAETASKTSSASPSIPASAEKKPEN